jgi:hypothetical protein
MQHNITEAVEACTVHQQWVVRCHQCNIVLVHVQGNMFPTLLREIRSEAN